MISAITNPKILTFKNMAVEQRPTEPKMLIAHKKMVQNISGFLTGWMK